VSYGLRIARDAIEDLRMLQPWLQEEVLDELELLAADPSRLRVDVDGRAAHDFERVDGGIRHVVFLRVLRDDPRTLLILLGLGMYARPERNA
jgi:hypothetical protein